MKNNFDLTNYMKSNKVGAYQQLNESMYVDIQPLGDFNTINEEEEMEEGKKQLAFVIPCPDAYDIEEEAEHFQYLLDKAGVKAKAKANMVGEEVEVYTKDEKKARKVIEKNGYQIGWNDEVEDNGQGEPTQSDDQEQSHYLDIPTGPDKGWKNEMAGDNVKSLGAGKMAHANTRTNLARHRSSDMLDKMSKKDHDKKTVVGAKAAAYKAPHMKESEFNTVGKDLTLNDLNKDIVITPFELEKTWKDVYGEDFKTEYSGVHSYLTKNYKNFTIVDLGDVWERMYGEDFLQEYPGISRWLFSNQGKTSSKDKVAPKMNEDEDDIFAGSDDADWTDHYGNDTSEWDTNIAGQTVEGWTAEETQGGAISWQNPKYPHTIVYATPGWEGVNGIAFEVYSEAEDGMDSDAPMMQKVIGAGTDLWKTEKGYLALMDKAFTALEMKLTPSVDMEDMNEDEDPFGAIKTGIDKITNDYDEDMSDDDRFDTLGGDKIKAGIENLMADGFDYREILQFVKDTIASKRNY